MPVENVIGDFEKRRKTKPGYLLPEQQGLEVDMVQTRRIRRRSRRTRPLVRRTPSSSAAGVRAEAKQSMGGEGGLMIGGVHDPAEKQADRMADRVMRMPSPGPMVHRKCERCEGEENKVSRMAAGSEEEETVQTKAAPGPAVAPAASAAPASPGATTAIRSMGSGKPLARADKAFFEPRMGTDLSSVRVHDGPAADKASKGINARAFTHGNDVAFAKGEYQPGTQSGRHLMAHELAHVVGDATNNQPLRRATLATADHASTASYKKVPDKHKTEVNAGLKLLEAQAKKKKCKDYFKDNCSAGGGSLANAISGATVYWMDNNSKQFGESLTRNVAGDARTIAYNTYAYNVGRFSIGGTLLHEMFHTCILGSIPNEEIVAETSVEECEFYSPWLLGHKPGTLDVGDKLWLHGFQLGPTQDADHYIKLDGVKITSYDKWVLDPSNSWVEVEFKIPKTVNDNYYFSKTVDVVAVNHGVESNKRPLKVHP